MFALSDVPKTPREVAIQRRGSVPLSSRIVEIISRACVVPDMHNFNDATKNILSTIRSVKVPLQCSPELSYEFGRDGGHAVLSLFIKKLEVLMERSGDAASNQEEEDYDPLSPSHRYEIFANAIGDLVDEVYSLIAILDQFPLAKLPLTIEERRAREPKMFRFSMPSVFPDGTMLDFVKTMISASGPVPKFCDFGEIPPDNPFDSLLHTTSTMPPHTPKAQETAPSSTSPQLEIIISQIQQTRQSSQHDVGYLMWPSAVLLSHFIIEKSRKWNQLFLVGNKVLEIGSGEL